MNRLVNERVAGAGFILATGFIAFLILVVPG
jgi:hypothetical protein